MFQQTFVPEERSGRRPLGVLFSLSLQMAVVVSISLLHLIYVQPLPSAQLKAFLAGPMPPSQLKPVVRQASAENHVPVRVSQFRLTAPVRIPRQISPAANLAEAPEIASAESIPGTADGAVGTALLDGLVVKNAPAPRPPEQPKPVPRGPVPIGGSVAAANLIHQVQPAYPALAKSARVEGTVVYQAIIDKTGRVVKLQMMSGHFLLVNAAREAILQWRYRPTLLNGQPVEVETTITMHFTLTK